MDIKIPSSGPPAPTPAQESGPSTAEQAVANTQISTAPSPSQSPPTTGFAIPLSRVELHSARQPEILRQSLLALLDRASEKMGELPPESREQAAEFLAADPYLGSRVLSYLDQLAQKVR